MSKKRTPFWSCFRKIRYAKKPEANPVVEPYECNLCGGWHMRRRVALQDGDSK